MSELVLDYDKLLQILSEIGAMGDKLFHSATVHKPEVRTTSPMIWNNVADFSAVFEWTFEVSGNRATGNNLRWTRGKNVMQYLRKLNKAGEASNLVFDSDWNDIEFGIRHGLEHSKHGEVYLVMFMSIPIKAATPEQWKRIYAEQEAR